MYKITNSIINISHKAVKFLRRDYIELEMLQRSTIGNYNFCNNASIKLQNILLEEFSSKITKFVFFSYDDFLSKQNLFTSEELILIINPIDSYENLERSIPFFALSITCLKKNKNTFNPICSIMNFPALNKLYYAENAQGVKLENDVLHSEGKLHVSGRRKLENILLAVDNINIDIPFTKKIRIFGSNCFAVAMFASGKIDAIYFSSIPKTLELCFELIIKESGGVISKNDQLFIASTPELIEKIKKYSINLLK